MSLIPEENLRSLQQHRSYTLVLGLSLAFFLYKGILYATLGSFIPLLLIVLILLLFSWSIKRSAKAARRVLAFWLTLLLLWAFSRLLFTLADRFVKPFNEGHVYEQLTGWGLIWSLVALVAGSYLWYWRKSVFPPSLPISNEN